MAEASSSKGLEPYLHHVVIDSRPEPRLFREVADPWQWSLNRRVIPALERASGFNKAPYDGPKCFYLVMPKGHDKTSFLGRLLNGILAFAPVAVSCTGAAADKDQARLLIEAMEAEARLNKWLEKRLKFSNYEVQGLYNNSKLEVISADAPSASGLRFDICLVDELTEWPKRDLWDKLYAGRRKRPDCVFLLITNAGVKYEWPHQLLEAAKTRPDLWWVFEAPGPLASWMDKAKLEEEKAFLHETEFAKKYMNIWLSPNEQYGFVPYHNVLSCLDLGRELNLSRVLEGDPSKRYFAAIDYGPVKDRTVMAVGHQEGDTVIVDRMDVLQGSKENRVKIADVEAWIDDIRKSYRLERLTVDNYQMEGTVQRYTGVVPIEVFKYRGTQGNYELAQALRTLLVNRRVAWYDGCGDVFVNGNRHTLADEINELVVKHVTGGYRLDHLPSKHDDRVVTLGMLCLSILQSKLKHPLLFSDAWF